jgi:hypothetical protein
MAAASRGDPHSKAAWVAPDDVFTNMSTEDMAAQADKDVSFGYFNRMEDAIRWAFIPQQTNGLKATPSKSKADL